MGAEQQTSKIQAKDSQEELDFEAYREQMLLEKYGVRNE
jgi:hypothetical protein